MASHSVGDDVQAELAENREVVLVVVSFSSDVRLAGDFDAERFGHGLPWESGWRGDGALRLACPPMVQKAVPAFADRDCEGGRVSI